LTALKDMTANEAASKGIETILRGMYDKYSWKDANTLADDYDVEDGNFDEESCWKEVKYEAGSDPVTVDGFTAKVEDQYGGEGQGEQHWVVISVSDGETTRYFRKDGWYASYDGGYLDGDTSEVTPREKTIVVYE
jgi:hypothetical protein